MDDRELLELAAKAAGADYEVDPDTGDIEILDQIGGMSGGWNPLTDDGDALRLAVKMGLRIYTPDDDDKTAVVRDYAGLHVTQEASTTDFYAATRRAIVRAAAALAQEQS